VMEGESNRKAQRSESIILSLLKELVATVVDVATEGDVASLQWEVVTDDESVATAPPAIARRRLSISSWRSPTTARGRRPSSLSETWVGSVSKLV
jgi:hypothetical protein